MTWALALVIRPVALALVLWIVVRPIALVILRLCPQSLRRILLFSWRA